jgi:hypothetical protein
MKRIKLKIGRNTKLLMLSLSVVGVLGFSALHTAEAKRALPSMALVGMVATMKKKGIWDSATPETKAFAEAQDEANSTLIDEAKLAETLKKYAEISLDEKGLNKEQMAEFKELVDGYKTIAAKLKKLEDGGLNAQGDNPVLAALKDEKGLFAQFKAKKLREFDLEIKATQSDTADIANHTIGYRVPGIGQLPVRAPFMMDIFPTVPVNLEFVKYMDQATVVRDANNVAGIAPSTSTTALTWIERNIQITKVRDFIYLNIDMLSDYDFVLGELQRLINSSVILKADNGLLKDDGVYPNLHSVNEKASEFDATNTLGGTITAWAGTVQSPNIFDLSIAMASQIIALGKDNAYMPDTILWNTIDKYKSMLVKDKYDNYLLPPFVVKVGNTEYAIDNMKVRANPNVPANSMYVFDSTKGTIYMRKGVGLEMAYNNKDQFEYEVATMKGYLRMNLLIRNVDANAFMKCSDVQAAITALATA